MRMVSKIDFLNPRNSTRQNELEIEFKKTGIPFTSPGFYENLNFLQAEKKNSRYLEKYLEYVLFKRYDQSYLNDARIKIRSICSFLSCFVFVECLNIFLDFVSTLRRNTNGCSNSQSPFLNVNTKHNGVLLVYQ